MYLCTVANRIKHVCECSMPIYLFRVIVLQFMKDIIVSTSCFVPVFNIVLISHRKCEHFWLFWFQSSKYNWSEWDYFVLFVRQTHLHGVTSARFPFDVILHRMRLMTFDLKHPVSLRMMLRTTAQVFQAHTPLIVAFYREMNKCIVKSRRCPVSCL